MNENRIKLWDELINKRMVLEDTFREYQNMRPTTGSELLQMRQMARDIDDQMEDIYILEAILMTDLGGDLND